MFLVNSCRKNKPLFDGINCTNNCYILSGRLLDSAVNSGIANAEIKFYFTDITGTIIKKTSFLGKTLTDNNGNYTFKFDGTNYKNPYGYFYVEAYKGNLFHDPFYGNRVSTFDLDSTLFNAPFIQNFSLFRPAYIKIRVTATLSTIQSLTLSYHYGVIGNGIVLNGGRSIDTTLTYKTAGDIRTFIQADISSVGFLNSKKDTIIVKANTTANREIRF